MCGQFSGRIVTFHIKGTVGGISDREADVDWPLRVFELDLDVNFDIFFG